MATGGVEQNGPYVVTGKHNYILETITEVIARKLGNALVAPIIKLVPLACWSSWRIRESSKSSRESTTSTGSTLS